jgi:hypothetical protein
MPVYIFSWEDIPFYSDDSTYINAQARFFFNGTIELCSGTANSNGRSIAAFLSDPSYPVFIPATDGAFGYDGMTINGEGPTNLCQAFSVTDVTPWQPTEYPTSEPLWWPTIPPSSSPVSQFLL